MICDSTKCYLYYAGDNGHIYKSSLPIADFPGEFPGAEDSGIQGTSQNLFEAVQVYAVKGSDQYLMIVEAQGVSALLPRVDRNRSRRALDAADRCLRDQEQRDLQQRLDQRHQPRRPGSR